MSDGVLWTYSGPALVTAASPLLSPWFGVSSALEGANAIDEAVLWWAAAGGTTTVTVQGSFDGVTADADLTAAYSSVASGTPFNISSARTSRSAWRSRWVTRPRPSWS